MIASVGVVVIMAADWRTANRWERKKNGRDRSDIPIEQQAGLSAALRRIKNRFPPGGPGALVASALAVLGECRPCMAIVGGGGDRALCDGTEGRRHRYCVSDRMASLTHLFSISTLFPGVSEFQRRIDTMSLIVVLALALGALGFVAVLTLVHSSLRTARAIRGALLAMVCIARNGIQAHLTRNEFRTTQDSKTRHRGHR